MALTKISRGLLSTGISDSSDATAITITSGEKVQVKTGFTMNSSVASNNTGDFKIIESANSTAGVGYAAPIIGVNIDDAVNGSNTPTQDNVWGGVSGASALSLSADMSADNATHMFWGSGATESAGTALTKLLSVSRNGGISFGTDTCNDANTLDDYEEGSWTPVAAGVTTAVSYAGFTKIGRFVYCHAYINFVPPNNSSQFQITGLPFPSSGGYFGGTIGYVQNKNFNDFFGPIAALNQSYIYFHKNDGVDASIANSTVYALGGGTTQYIIFTFSYMTA